MRKLGLTDLATNDSDQLAGITVLKPRYVIQGPDF